MLPAECSELLYKHIEKYIGPISNVFKEIIPGEVGIDVLVAGPTPQRNYYTLVTSGMSARPMTVPNGAEEYQYAELMISLPPTWKLSDEDFRDERNYWPIGAMKRTARFPHEYQTWLYRGHTVANGNPPERYSVNTDFQSMLLWVPEVEDEANFFNLTVSEGKTLQFYSLIPLYKEECDYSIQNGSNALLSKLGKVGTTSVVNLSRKNSCKKIFGIY